MRIMAMRVDIIFLLACLLILAKQTEVDNLNILLPELKQSQSSLPLQLISAQKGCYEWNSSYPEYLQVNPHQPTNTGCSRQAVISVAKLGSYSSTIYVSAIDGASQATLKIPVRIRKLNKISIASKSRMMNIKELQKLQLFGYDADGNTFTSVEGLRFKWELQQDTQIIQTVLIQNAHLYLPLKTRENLQKRGYQSDMLVVKAIAPGHLKVRVRCIQSGYQSLIDQITISVHERFELKPGPTINMATDTQFQLRLVRPNDEQIKLPQLYYRIVSCKDFIINQTLYLKVPSYPSKCTIKVQDTRTKPAYQSSVEIIVSQANQMKIVTDQLIIVGKQSKYHVQLYQDGLPLFGQSTKIFYSSDFSLNKQNKTLVAERKGSGYLSAQLGSLKKSIVINALLPVTVLLPENYIHLPVGEYFKLKVLGGTGVYDFQIRNDIISVNAMSILHAKLAGQTIMIIKDRSHSINQIVIRVKISEISQIQSLQKNKETNKDQWGYLYMIAQNKASETFTQCVSAQFSLSLSATTLDLDNKVNFVQSVSFLQFHRSQLVQAAIAPTSLLKGKQYEIIERYSQYVKQNEINSKDLKNYILSLQNYGICKALKFKSTISFEEKALISLEGYIDVKTIVPLRVYELIQTTIQNEDNIFLMTPDSSLNWTYTGGSYRWTDSSTRATVNGEIVRESIYPIIRCPNRQTASQKYGLKVQNQQSASLLFPVSQTTSISLVCKFPKKLHLGLQHGQIFDELYIQRQTEVKGIVKATDELSQQFYNSSNVIYEFSSLRGDLSYSGKYFHYKTKGNNDTLTIYTNKLNNGLTYGIFVIEIKVYIVDPLVIAHPLSTDKKQLTIVTLFTPQKPYILHAKNIYSQLQIQCSDAVSCQKGQNYIAVKLLRVGRGTVHIKDKKIYGSQDWHFEFIIVQPDEVRISGNKDYLQEGDTLQLNVTIYYNQDLISPFTYDPSYLNVILPVNLQLVEQKVQTFIVRAKKAGQYHIQGENNYPRIRRTKQTWNITVYKKISINIEDVTSKQEENLYILQANTAVVIGCRRFLRIEGGPHEITSKISSTDSAVTLNQLSQRNFQLSSKKQGIYDFTLEVYYKENRITVIYVKVNVNKIQKIQLQTIDQPVIGSHFRINPKFKIGQSNLQQMYCDYIYEWKTAKDLIKFGQTVSFGLLDATSINATALQAGNEVITLEVKQKNGDLIIKQNKYLEVLDDIKLDLPTYINRVKCETIPTSILMPPNTRHVFNKQIKLKSDEGIIYIGQQQNILQTSKRLGHSTLRLSQPGYRTMHMEVQIKQIMGIFIQNQEGFISIEPNHEKELQIYLQDNHGRLFYTPLQSLDIFVSSSNNDLVEVSLTNEGNSILLRSYKQGVCIIYVKIPSRNIFDSIAVSVGSAISPARQITVTENGIIKFKASSSQAEWSSDNKDIVSINAHTGYAHALRVGTATIHYGQLSSVVTVLQIAKVEQVGQQVYKNSTMQVEYQLFWLVNNNYEEISNIRSQGSINNNLNLACVVNNRNLIAKAFIIEKGGYQRLICQIKLHQNQNWPYLFSIRIQDEAGLVSTEQFKYKFKPIFKVDKHQIILSPQKPQADIIIETPSPLQVFLRNGKPKWIVSSSFDQKKKQHRIKINMQGEQTDSISKLQISLQGQQSQIQLEYRLQGESKKHNFWSYDLDWPDYLIILMGVIFFVICYLQYNAEYKIKDT